jgi:hypothetical protein
MNYEFFNHLEHDRSAIYQIKVKGRVSNTIVSVFDKSVEITLETSDPDKPITMLTGQINNQEELMRVLHVLYSKRYPIISVACIEVPKENEIGSP